MAAVPPIHTACQAMIRCGVNDVDLFEGRTKAQRIAEEIFQDDFHTCMDKTFEDLHSDFKTYSDLTIGQGQIRLVPGIKNKIRAFIQWCRDE